MRLTLVISSLRQGGAERVMCMLANAWAGQGREVTLLNLEGDGESAYPLHASVRRRNLGLLSEPSRNLLHSLVRNAGRIRILRRVICESDPDVVISFMDLPNVLTLAAVRGMSRPVIVSERIHPAFYDSGTMWRRLRDLLYPSADALVCQTNAILGWFKDRMQINGRVIPNPVTLPPQWEKSPDPHRRWVTAMGRLDRQKGFDLLLEAFARIASKNPQWSLRIIGDGGLRETLQQQCRALALQERVDFAGLVKSPFPLLGSSDVFVLSSRFEGFPNALCEAMACGLPVISFDCPSGPADIIRHEIDGLLVPPENVAALADCMDRLMNDPVERNRLASRAPEVATRFSLEKIMALWEELFEEVLPARRTARRSQ